MMMGGWDAEFIIGIQGGERVVPGPGTGVSDTLRTLAESAAPIIERRARQAPTISFPEVSLRQKQHVVLIELARQVTNLHFLFAILEDH